MSRRMMQEETMRYVYRTLAASLVAVCATPPSWAAERFWSNPSTK